MPLCGCVVGCCYPEVSSFWLVTHWPSNNINRSNAMVDFVHMQTRCTSYRNGGPFLILHHLISETHFHGDQKMYLGVVLGRQKFFILSFRIHLVRGTLCAHFFHDFDLNYPVFELVHFASWRWLDWVAPSCSMAWTENSGGSHIEIYRSV
jgi:hypothetical protein